MSWSARAARPFWQPTTKSTARASVTGEGIAYYTRYPAVEAERSGFRYVARRSPAGWSAEEVAPQDSPSHSSLFNCYQAVDFSADLARSILSDGWDPAEDGKSGFCGESEEPLDPAAPRGYGNL